MRPGPPDPSLLRPGGRPPAPAELGLVQAFANTRNDEFENDGLGDATRLRAFLARHGLAGAESADEDDAARCRAVREALRRLVVGTADAADAALLDATADAAGLSLRHGPGASRLVVRADGVAGALGAILVAARRALDSGEAGRLKPCRSCGWLFFDQSRNRSGAWCAMSICGNRSKTRRYRAAHRPLSPP